jgi:hypothetical protein
VNDAFLILARYNGDCATLGIAARFSFSHQSIRAEFDRHNIPGFIARFVVVVFATQLWFLRSWFFPSIGIDIRPKG